VIPSAPHRASGRRPFRVRIDPARNGGDVVSTVADRVRAEFYHRIDIDIADLLPEQAGR
jgi:hypothetical protein